jgi:integrase
VLRGSRSTRVLVEVGGRLYPRAPKTEASLADVVIDAELLTVLRSHLEAGFAQPGIDGLVFTSAQGGALRRSNFGKRILGPAAERAIGKWVSPHDLRRSYGSMLLEAGVQIVAVSKLMRHGKVETTLRHYAGLFEGGEEAAVERFYQWRYRGDIGPNPEAGGAERDSRSSTDRRTPA